MDDVFAFLDDRATAHVDLLCDLIARPSRTGHLEELDVMADHLVGLFASTGWVARSVPVEGWAPVVLAERPAPSGAPTVLLYSHYDVISPEPIDGWTHPPFSAVREGGRIYGRGSTDAKANVLALVKGIDALTEVRGGCPIGVKLILDGDEERGSPGIPLFIDEHEEELLADAALSFDGSIDPSGVPKIGLGTGGMVFVDMICDGRTKELHSAKSRLFENPAWRLVWALGSMRDPDGSMRIDGFDEAIVPATTREREMMAEMPWDDAKQLAEAGHDRFLGGVTGVDAVDRLLYTPGVTICGIHSGYTDEGPKAVIPNRAMAKVEFRIVPDQTPDAVLGQLRSHLDRHGFDDVELKVHSMVETAKTDPDASIVDAAVRAATALYGPPMVKPTEEYAGRQGAWLGERFGIPGVQTGIGPPDSNTHAVDEFVTEEHFLKGIKYAAAILDAYCAEYAGD